MMGMKENGEEKRQGIETRNIMGQKGRTNRTKMSKRKRTLQTVNVGAREDRISRLPMDLLVRILSFLPIVDAVRCSILSSNWRELWSFLTVLDLDESAHANFIRMVDNVLIIHKFPYAETFRLKCRTVDAFRLRRWLRLVMLHNVRDIDIDLHAEQTFTLPRELFTCNSLVSLRIVNESHVRFPFSVNLPHLKVLHVSLYYPTNKITRKLFCNCPVLEDLEISSSIDKDQDIIFDIASPALKKLKLDLHTDDYFTDEVVHPRNKIVINAPVLEDLTAIDDYLAGYSLNNVASLVSACIDVGTCCMQALGTVEHACYLVTLLEGITNVKFLTLQSQTMGVLDSMVGVPLPLFPNLVHLVVFVNNCYRFKRIWDLLASAPNLVTLELIRDFAHEDNNFSHEKLRNEIPDYIRVHIFDFAHDGDTMFDNFSWVEPERTPACFLSDLERIDIFGFKGLKCELVLLKYLLKKAKALKKVQVNSHNISMKKQRRLLRQLASFKGFKTCEFELVSEFRSLI